MKRQLYVYDYVDVPFDDVERVLSRRPEAVLQGATDAAAGTAEQLVGRLHVQLGDFEVGRDVRVSLGPGRPRGSYAVSFPIHWVADHQAALFPSLDAQLEIATLAAHPPVTQISLIADYEPPFGLIGVAGDALLGHRVAEAALRDFVTDVIGRLEAHYEGEKRAAHAPALLD